MMKTIYAYKNTRSYRGSPTEYQIVPQDVIRANVWVNCYGNPYYGLWMSDGTTYLLIDDYGGMNQLDHLTPRRVTRKKGLV